MKVRRILPALMALAVPAIVGACNRAPAVEDGGKETMAARIGLRVDKQPETPAPAPLEMTGAEYARTTLILGIYSEKAAKIALRRSRTDDVRLYARQLESAATTLVPQLRDILKKKGLSAPSDELGDTYAELLKQLETAPDFDRTFLDQQGRVMTDALTLNQSYARGGTDSDLRAHADRVAVELGGLIERCHRLAVAHADAPQE